MKLKLITVIVFILTISFQLYRPPRSSLEEIAFLDGFPVYRYQVNATTANKVNREVKRYCDKTGLDASDKEGWNAQHLSNAFYEQEDNDLPTLIKEMSIPMTQLCEKHCLSSKNVSIMIDSKNDYWVNIYNPDHHQGAHTHINEGDKTPFYCFTYFSKYVHGLDAPLRFHPLSGAVITPEIQQGDILIFPPTLHHSVDRQKGTGPRITVSGNIYHEDI